MFIWYCAFQVSKRCSDELAGKNDANVRVIFAKQPVPDQSSPVQQREIKPGDYIAVKVSHLFMNIFMYM